MKKIVAAALAGLALVGFTACGEGGTKTVTEIVNEDVGTVTVAPETTSDEGTLYGEDVKIGSVAEDGNLSFRVLGVKAISESQFMRSPYATGDETAGPGQKWIVADVEVENNGSVSQTPFCGGLGTTLITTPSANYDLSNATIEYVDNKVCSSDLAPGFKDTYKLFYLIPSDRTWKAVAVWDPEEPGDFDGSESYLTFVK